MADNSRESRERAEVRFAKAQKAADVSKEAWADHDAEARAVRAKTSRLRALRLAKEAADAEAGPEVKKKPVTRRKKPPA